MYQSLANVFYLTDQFEPFPHEKVALIVGFVDDLTLTTQSIPSDIDVAKLWRQFVPEGNVPIDEYLEQYICFPRPSFKSNNAQC